jgi:hypothetical protein
MAIAENYVALFRISGRISNIAVISLDHLVGACQEKPVSEAQLLASLRRLLTQKEPR